MRNAPSPSYEGQLVRTEVHDPASHEEAAVRRPRWAQVFRVLWKIIAALGTTVVLGAVASIIATVLTSSQGSIPATSPLRQLLAAWPITLLAGCCLLLLALLIWLLSRWHTHEAVLLSEQNRTRMLQRLRRTYHDLLVQSLEGAVWVELGFKQKPDAVLTSAHLLLRLPDQPERNLPPGTSILQVYMEAEGELLILGKPGAGKSTLLLALAQQLVEQAQDNVTQPLPVILPLSSWATKRRPLQDWASRQMAQIYHVPRQVCEYWLQHNQILLMLDGLDEMEEEARPACIAAINAYHHEHMMPLVVCSREAEYTNASKYQRLALQGAVIVRPLTKRQVNRHLTQVGAPVAALRQAFTSNPRLQELATTPLMLNLLMLTYQGTAVKNLSAKGAALQQQVFDTYIRRMVERRGSTELYPIESTRRWLGWLARQLRKHNQPIFYPERLQPDWLPAKQQRWYTWLAVRLPGALIGALAGLLTAPLLITFDPGLLLQYSILSAFLGAVFSVPRACVPAHAAQHPHRRQPSRLTPTHGLACAAVALVWGVVFLLNTRSADASTSWPFQCMSSAASGLVIGLSCLLLMVLLPRTARKPTRTAPQDKGWWSRLRHIVSLHGRRALLAATIFGIGIWLSDALSDGPSNELGAALYYGLSNGLSAALNYGLLSVMVSVMLRTLGGGIHLAERLRWTRRSLLRSLFSAKHLRSTLVLIFVSLVLFGVSQGLGPWLNQGLDQGLGWGLSWGLWQGLGWGLSCGLSCWLLLGLFQGISHERIEDRDRRLFNQGIRDSLRNSMLMTVISALLIGIMSVLSWGLSYELSYGLNYGLSWGLSYELSYELGYGLLTGLSQGLSHAWLFVVSGGLLIGIALSGGLAVLRHYILRFLLQRADMFPWRAQPFLEDAGRRILLRCIDGKYSFTHRLLQDYLADQATSVPEKK